MKVSISSDWLQCALDDKQETSASIDLYIINNTDRTSIRKVEMSPKYSNNPVWLQE